MPRAKLLSFERKLEISNGRIRQIDSAQKSAMPIPVTVFEKTVRGTISNDQKNKDVEDLIKKEADPKHANIQTVDAAFLDSDKNTLVVDWTCKVLPFEGKPAACGEPAYSAKLQEVIRTYINEHGFSELARRYAINILNARWLWRNRLGARDILVEVICQTTDGEQKFSFQNVEKIDLNNFSPTLDGLDQLAKLIEAGFEGKQLVILNITAYAAIGYGQEVFPSQEFIRSDDGGKGKGKKSKVLCQLGSSNHAGFHSQKLSNAIRTIDTWYPNAQFPIAAEPYGTVTPIAEVFRKGKDSFYKLLDNWTEKGQVPPVEQQHYIAAVLIRGGVFGSSSEE